MENKEIVEMLRSMAWAEAKGKLDAFVQTFYHAGEDRAYDEIQRAINYLQSVVDDF